ncbi:putative peptide ABC transporter permease [Actinacidiphila reveromycinica]|uniref:Putative peptide ABC transporter permease n=1 Tax=Actinacidiphila reveromycinica TaxID=659352 RepID=A0A7U3VS36_9ACTN|nr:ABC transporter permease [Streptomyces sp. SN-593]BBB01451.1 putative peptide ABC transporter permease [Streptomyces sp. SN-593]
MTAPPASQTAPKTPTGTVAPARRPSARALLLLPALLFLALLVLAAAAPGLFTSAAPNATDPLLALRPPGSGHWFGTDQLGRDLYTRVVYGTRLSLLLGAGATAMSVLAGAALGLAAGLGGRLADQALMRLADVLLALPPILLALLAVAVLGSGTVNVALAIAAAFAPGYARIVRAETLVVRRSGYVEAATTLGLSRPVLVLRHVVPNALGPLLVLATVGFGSSLIAASGLSFLGLGPQPPTAEWGAMLDQGRDFLQTAWWLGVFPGAAITLTALVVNVVGRQAQARFTRRTGR